ncbi:hypothetical protein [Microvirga roseola]|uniref:hypothetical protein n=1 Tax=Microvirga roseola TaxID=2883126 RepID=UPI001E5E8A2D|nr:hypothetical protein [Microvirga roseola]
MIVLNYSREKEISSPGGRLKRLALFSLIAGFGLAALPVEAHPGRSKEKPTKEKVVAVAVKDPETTGSLQADEEGPYCNQSRKRLFVEGEGWIVRRVTTCY